MSLQKEETMPSDPARSSSSQLIGPASLGLFGLGLTLVLLNLYLAGLLPIPAALLGVGLLLGGLLQIGVGLAEWKNEHPFGAAVFVSYGLFCLSLVALVILPQLGLGEKPQPTAMVAYLVMWGLFTIGFFIAALGQNRALQLVFGSLTLLLFLLAAVGLSASTLLLPFAGYVGLICGLSAVYTAVAQGLNEYCGRPVAPLGMIHKP
jgi:succinate-acetate transporter protein